MSVSEVNVEQLAAAMSAGARVVDVREESEYVAGHVAGAVHVPLGTVPDNVDAFRGDGPVYVICMGGGRSMRACEFVSQFGIDAVNIAGGTRAWMQSGRPVVEGSAAS